MATSPIIPPCARRCEFRSHPAIRKATTHFWSAESWPHLDWVSSSSWRPLWGRSRDKRESLFPPAPVIAGTPGERGQSYGKQFREPIREFLDKEIYTAFIGKPSTKEQMLAYAAACGKVLRDECPTIAAEFQGIAEGSDRG
jgi:hypothetical protein